MKNKLIICLIALVSFSTTTAQSFIGFDIGFNVPAAGAALPGFEEIKLRDGQTVPDTTALIASMNIGLSVQLRYGKWINNNVAIGIDAGYLTGTTKGDFEVYLGPNVIAVNTVSGKMFNISPSVTISTDNSQSKTLYLKFGPTLATAFNTKVETEIEALGFGGSREFLKGSAIGFKSALGARKNLGDNLALFGELSITSLMHKPKELKVTDATGTSTLNIVKTTGPGSPLTDTRSYAIPYSSIALNIGLQFSL